MEAYFSGLEAKIVTNSQCLASMYGAGDLVNRVKVEPEGNQAFVSQFSNSKPNVLDLSDVAVDTIKLDRAGGFTPSAAAPLVIRVPAGTTKLGAINFEGWSPQRGAQQTFSRYILLDLSDVTGEVTVDGLTMGAIWAPKANLTFNSGVTTNGQWLAKSLTLTGGGEMHHQTFGGLLPCAGGSEPSTSTGTSTPAPSERPGTLPQTGTDVAVVVPWLAGGVIVLGVVLVIIGTYTSRKA